MEFNKPEGTKIICLTPVKNEAWILERFLKCASLWADHIVVADQSSTDDSREIAKRFEKVILVDNTEEDFTEIGMRSLLMSEARKIPAEKRILLSLDADELLSANWMDSPEWQTILDLPKGSVIRIPLYNWETDMQQVKFGLTVYCGFVDDELTNLSGGKMHSIRTPWPKYDITILETQQIKLLHYATVNKNRANSKTRWYQAYEKIARNRKGIDTWMQYTPKLSQSILAPAEWSENYLRESIDITSINDRYSYSFDHRVLDYLDQHGAEYFRLSNIWDKDWVDFARDKKENPERFANPQSKLDRFVFKFAQWAVRNQTSVLKVAFIRTALSFFRKLGY